MPNETHPLLVPRYEVIADYPNNIYPLGAILQESPLDYCFPVGELTTPHNVIAKKTVTRYPYLFKPLQWWEKREIGEMPECLMRKCVPKAVKVESWGGEDKNLFFFENDCYLTRNYEPATPEQYTTFITSKDK